MVAEGESHGVNMEHGAWGMGTEVRGHKDRDQRSEVRGQRAEIFK